MTGNSKAWLGTFGEIGHPYSHPSTKQCSYAYTHPTAKQCNYSYTHPNTKQCNYSYTHPYAKQCDAAAGNHTHTPASIGAAASSHNHDAGNITSGTLPAARGGTGVTSLDALKSALNIPTKIFNTDLLLSFSGSTNFSETSDATFLGDTVLSSVTFQKYAIIAIHGNVTPSYANYAYFTGHFYNLWYEDAALQHPRIYESGNSLNLCYMQGNGTHDFSILLFKRKNASGDTYGYYFDTVSSGSGSSIIYNGVEGLTWSGRANYLRIGYGISRTASVGNTSYNVEILGLY